MAEKYLAVLGRLPKISLAELEANFDNVRIIHPCLAEFEAQGQAPKIARFGGSLKFAVELEGKPLDYLMGLPDGKITLGVSDYSKGARARSSQSEALKLKKILGRNGRGVRVVPNKEAVLSTATSHHNQIAEKKNHVELIKNGKKFYRVIGVQNITEYAKRDQARPARDAKVGMLPPKLAQILLNLNGPLEHGVVVLDPFCGTGVVLQEAYLDGFRIMGTDLSERMIEYSKRNLDWLGAEAPILEVGDATKTDWKKLSEIDAVATEVYLGAPMSKPPVEIKLRQEKEVTKAIIVGFLKNLAGQIISGTPVTLAIPAWLRENGQYSRLNVLDEIEGLGYNLVKFNLATQRDLLYYREGQVVAREILSLRKI